VTDRPAVDDTDEAAPTTGSPRSPSDADPRGTLLQLRESLVAEVQASQEALLELRRLRADRSDDDEHDPEGAPLSGEWSRLDGRVRAARQRVRDVDDAVANVDAGRYGICERCGQPIAPGRLEVLPTATRCVRCADRP
jgi:RNA polymerase-binding transcription factor DksA